LASADSILIVLCCMNTFASAKPILINIFGMGQADVNRFWHQQSLYLTMQSYLD
jgi:hypothetical protein